MSAKPPPKKLKSEIVHLNQSLHHIERQQHAGIQRAPDSLPVLEAFQEYLARERKRANRRVAAMVVLFALILVAIGTVSIGVVLLLSRDMSNQAMAFTQRTGVLENQLGDLVDTTDESLGGIQERLAALQSGLTTAQQEQLDQQAASGSAASNLTSRIDGYSLSLAALNEELAALRAHNANVQTRLSSITNELAEVAARPIAFPPTPARLGGATVVEPAGMATNGALRLVPMGTTPQHLPVETITLPIVPPGESTPVKWRIPFFKREGRASF